jgi:hypothetical protein
MNSFIESSGGILLYGVIPEHVWGLVSDIL